MAAMKVQGGKMVPMSNPAMVSRSIVLEKINNWKKLERAITSQLMPLTAGSLPVEKAVRDLLAVVRERIAWGESELQSLRNGQ